MQIGHEFSAKNNIIMSSHLKGKIIMRNASLLHHSWYPFKHVINVDYVGRKVPKTPQLFHLCLGDDLLQIIIG